MKIGVFAYNFEHKKTQEGLLRLFLEGYKVNCILAADPVELKFYQSKVRISPKSLSYTHPRKIAESLGINYHVVKHNSAECIDFVKKYNLDVGIILGARILKTEIINAFKVGIMNLHPGLLPQNRGLDTIKWAILKGFRQGATSHLIDNQIDKGKLILREEILVYEDDTLLDIFLRIQNKEQDLMVNSLKILSSEKEFQSLGEGNYSKSVPPDIEKNLFKVFEKYKIEYNNLLNN